MTKTIKLFFFLPLILLCVLLGFWQIDRGNQKLDIYEAYSDKLKNPPLEYKTLKDYPEQFTKIKISYNLAMY